MKSRGTERNKALMSHAVWIAVLAAIPASFTVADASPPRVTLVSAGKYATLQEAVNKASAVFIPEGRHDLDQPLVIEGEDKVVVGAGRLDYGTALNFRGSNGIRIRNCRRLTLCNLWIRAQELTGDHAAVEVTGNKPCEINLLNTIIEGHIGLSVRGPARVMVQGCHFFGGDPGLLVANPNANVTVLGGNFQSEVVHIRQLSGHLEAYGIGFQLAKGGADIELNTASKKACIIAACRTEGPEYLLRTPDTSEKIDVIVKACSVPGDIKFVRYGAAGRLTLLGNNAPRGIEASTASATIWSVGNRLGCSYNPNEPYEIGAKAYAAADLWNTVKPNDPYREPGNAFITAEELKNQKRIVPPKVEFVQPEAAALFIPEASSIAPVDMPMITNIAELIPSVKSYGATGDGATDDTEALQRAFNANRNGRLFFPAGTYRITHPLFFDHRNGGWMVGEGKDKTTIINTAGGGVVRTDGCGYSTFQDIGFVAKEGGGEPAFDLSWDQNHKAPTGFLGAALQANIFYRCRFEGGAVGLSIGREGFMGSESLIVDSEFVRSKVGMAVCNYNALSNNAVRCVFQDDDVGVAQLHAGSFNVFESRFERSKDTDLLLKNSAGDCFYVLNTTSTSPCLLKTGNTGAIINVMLDGFRNLNQQPGNLMFYYAGGSVTFLRSELGRGALTADGNIAHKAVVLIGSRVGFPGAITAGGRAQTFIFKVKG